MDHIVSRAFAETVQETKERLSSRLIQFVENGKFPDFPSGQLLVFDSEVKAWDASIAKADAVVLVGGVGGTYDTGQIARRQHKPVLPLADTSFGYTHGDARRIYFEIIQSWNSEGSPGLTMEAFLSLADPAPGVASDVVRLLETLFGKQR